MPDNGMADAPATFEQRGPVALITLNRPDAMNAVNAALSEAVGTALETVARDPEIRVAVITGAGRAFCAGADLKELAAGRGIYPPDHPEWGFAGLVQHFIDKPLIAAVNGYALGGGTEIMLACDLAVVSDQAKLGLPEVKRGLLAAAGGLLRLPRQVPVKLAMEVALTGEPIDAETAARLARRHLEDVPDRGHSGTEQCRRHGGRSRLRREARALVARGVSDQPVLDRLISRCSSSPSASPV